MPCWGLFGQALIFSPVGQDEKIIWEGSAATHPAPERRWDSASLRAAAFRIALQVSNRTPESCSPAGEDNTHGVQRFLFTGKRGFRALELRTTKAFLPLRIIQNYLPFLPICGVSFPRILPLRTSVIHGLLWASGVFTNPGEWADLILDVLLLWLSLRAAQTLPDCGQAAAGTPRSHVLLLEGSGAHAPSPLLQGWSPGGVDPQALHLISPLPSPALGNWKYLLCVGSTKPSK